MNSGVGSYYHFILESQYSRPFKKKIIPSLPFLLFKHGPVAPCLFHLGVYLPQPRLPWYGQIWVIVGPMTYQLASVFWKPELFPFSSLPDVRHKAQDQGLMP